MTRPPSPRMVVHVLHHLFIGGMENGVVNLVNRLPRHEFDHTIVCIEDHSEFASRIQRDDVRVIDMHRSKVGTWRLRWQLWRLFKQLRPSVVHTRNLSGLDALLPARLAGARTVHSEHGYDVDNLAGKAARPTLLRRLHAPLVHRFACVSQDIQRLMVQHWGAAGKPLTQIYNGVDTAIFKPRPALQPRTLPTHLNGDDLFVVGTVGRVRPIKDQATLLRAVAQLLAWHPELRSRVRTVVVGDGPLLAQLAQLASELSIEQLCWFAGARDDVPALLQSMDVFVLPSLNEGISNTLLEAMACGVPILASAVGGNVELVERGVCGEWFEPGDVHTLARLLAAYACDPALRKRHAEAARERAVERFSIDSMMAAYAELYRTC